MAKETYVSRTSARSHAPDDTGECAVKDSDDGVYVIARCCERGADVDVVVERVEGPVCPA